MKFLIDAHLPPALVSGIRAAGHECDHVSEILGADALDMAIAKAANERVATLVSKDLDFVELARRGVLQAPLVRIRLGNMSGRVTCAIVLNRLSQIAAAIEAGDRIIELR